MYIKFHLTGKSDNIYSWEKFLSGNKYGFFRNIVTLPRLKYFLPKTFPDKVVITLVLRDFSSNIRNSE